MNEKVIEEVWKWRTDVMKSMKSMNVELDD
jgi:hypothetical protein